MIAVVRIVQMAPGISANTVYLRIHAELIRLFGIGMYSEIYGKRYNLSLKHEIHVHSYFLKQTIYKSLNIRGGGGGGGRLFKQGRLVAEIRRYICAFVMFCYFQSENQQFVPSKCSNKFGMILTL